MTKINVNLIASSVQKKNLHRRREPMARLPEQTECEVEYEYEIGLPMGVQEHLKGLGFRFHRQFASIFWESLS